MKPEAIGDLSNRSGRYGAARQQAEEADRSARSGKRLALTIAPLELCSIFGVDDANVASRLAARRR
jgi:hypothetical protein